MEDFFSICSKETLIKSVLQAMSVFRLPGKLLKEIESMLAKFWWNHKKEGTGIHWRSWTRLGDSKSNGGLGFHDLHCFNRAMLAKLVCRIIKDPSSLVARIYKAKIL